MLFENPKDFMIYNLCTKPIPDPILWYNLLMK